MNLFELDKIIEDCTEYSQESSKVASDAELNSADRKNRILNELKTVSSKKVAGDFYPQLDIMEKRASGVARGLLGLDSNKIGNPDINDALTFIFGAE